MPRNSRLRLSVLDVSPVASGSGGPEALRHSLDLAMLADRLGYTRYWLAEHHGSALVACSVPEILIGQVAAATQRIRVGSGGVMLPNHAPLHVAESFRMLGALFPGRIDLGLGRAPGTDGRTALALRRSRAALGADDFPEQLTELLGFLEPAPEGAAPPAFGTVVAAPTGVPAPPVYLLGSSDFSARLAAERGLGFAFAHHINPAPAVAALRFYSERFQPSKYRDEPHAFLAVSVICAETDAEADRLASSADLTLLGFQTGRFGPLPSVEEAAAYPYTEYEREIVRVNRDRMTVGSPETVRTKLSRLAAESGAEELIVSTLVHDHGARRRSYELLAQAFCLQTGAGAG